MSPPSDILRQGRAEFVQTMQQALAGLDEHVDKEIARVERAWEQKYHRMQKDLGSDVARLEARLKETEDERDALRRENAEYKDKENAGRREIDQKSVNELNDSLAKARERYDTTRGQLSHVVKIAQTRKEQIVGWIKYADSLEAKIQRMEKKRGRQSGLPHAVTSTIASSNANDTATMPPTPVTAEKEKPRPAGVTEAVAKPSMTASFSSSSSSFLGMIASFEGNAAAETSKTSAATVDSEQPELPQRRSPAHNAVNNEGSNTNEASLDSTQGEPSSDGSPPELPDFPTPRAATSKTISTHHTYIKEEPSSDGPEVVWERPVKRARTDDRSSTPLASAAMVPPVAKRERDALKSTPLASIAHYRESQESVDLDEGQLTVPTPRKRQLFLEQRSSESPLPIALGVATPLPTAPAPLPSTPLASVSVNIHRQKQKEDIKDKNLKRGIESLAEDNQGYSTPGGTPRRAMDPPSTSTTGRPSRLSSLLNSRPADSPVVSTSTPVSKQSPSKHNQFQLPPPRLLPHQRFINSPTPKTPGAVTASNTNSSAKSSAKRQPATPKATSLTAALNAVRAEIAAIKSVKSVKSTPKSALRAKPMDTLKMDDFKINPATNNGDSFAYNEVVRGRTDRASLAGCTDPQCCGKVFRGMATSELDAAGPSHIDRAEGVSLMEHHLGDEAYRLAEMTLAQKRELWVEARTRELADKYGKHRHRYHRRASPPGFWDTDFPTTQEEEYNRAEADKVERLTVQERYREAMKPGGRWLFRDE